MSTIAHTATRAPLTPRGARRDQYKKTAGAMLALTFAAGIGVPGVASAQYVTVYNPGYSVGYIAPPVTFVGTLQIQNNSGEPLQVVVDGLMIGMSQPGAMNFPNLTAGHKVIQLQNLYGVVRSVGRFFLSAGGYHVWSVAPAAISYTPTVQLYTPQVTTYNVMSMGSVQVENRMGTPVNIFVGGRMVGGLQTGQTGVYYSIPTGTAEVIAYNQLVSGQEVSRQTVNVVPGVRQYVNLLPQLGTVRVVNSRAEPVQLTVDNAQHTWVQPGQSFDLPNVAAGPRTLSAVVNGQVVQTGTATVYPGQVYAWYVRAAMGNIRVINRGFEPMTLMMNGVNQGAVAPQQERYFANLDSGRRSLQAMTSSGFPKSATDMDLTPGETRLWVIQP